MNLRLIYYFLHILFIIFSIHSLLSLVVMIKLIWFSGWGWCMLLQICLSLSWLQYPLSRMSRRAFCSLWQRLVTQQAMLCFTSTKSFTFWWLTVLLVSHCSVPEVSFANLSNYCPSLSHCLFGHNLPL